MIPLCYIFALCSTLFAIFSVFLVRKIKSPKKRNVWLLSGFFIFFINGMTWFHIIFHNIQNDYLRFILNAFCSGIFSFFMVIITYEFIMETIKKEDIKYNLQNLIGLCGVVTNKYQGDNFYVGYLLDDINTDIVVKINENVQNGSYFKIVSTDNGYISAILTDFAEWHKN